jgi:hypothetical protein
LPFTVSHAAAALPLRRPLGRFHVFPALVLGTMAPDFPYYLPIHLARVTTHTFVSIFWFSIPMSVAAYYLYERWLRGPLLFLLPAPLRLRLPEASRAPFTPDHLLAVAVSAGVGALTHVVWDSFTHATGAAVIALPWLRVVVARIGDYVLWRYKVIQHASTLGGGLVLATATWRWMQRTAPRASEPRPPVPPDVRRAVSVASLVVGITYAAGRAVRHSLALASIDTIHRFSGFVAVGILSTALALVCALSIVWHWRLRALERA